MHGVHFVSDRRMSVHRSARKIIIPSSHNGGKKTVVHNTKQMSSTDLPSLFPVTRSGRAVKISERFRNAVVWCIEYPSGVFVDKDGTPHPEYDIANYDTSDVPVCRLTTEDKLRLSRQDHQTYLDGRNQTKRDEEFAPYNRDEPYEPRDSGEDDSDEGDEGDDEEVDESGGEGVQSEMEDEGDVIDTDASASSDEDDDTGSYDDDEEEDDEAVSTMVDGSDTFPFM
jgi:hypothetical protein